MSHEVDISQDNWEVLNSYGVACRLDVVRAVIGDATAEVPGSMDPQVLTAAEVIASQRPEHIVALRWQMGVCRGIACGDLVNGVLTVTLANVLCLVDMPLKGAPESPLASLARLVGAKRIEIQAAQPLAGGFVEVGRVYRLEV